MYKPYFLSQRKNQYYLVKGLDLRNAGKPKGEAEISYDGRIQ